MHTYYQGAALIFALNVMKIIIITHPSPRIPHPQRFGVRPRAILRRIISSAARMHENYHQELWSSVERRW